MNENESNKNQGQEKEEIKARPQAYKQRSSLKPTNNLSPLKNIPQTMKRGSVNWDMSSNLDNLKSLNLKEMKISFKTEENNQEKRKFSDANLGSISTSQNKFAEARKMSIKNEFALVREMMKNNPIEELENEEEAIENTKKNLEIGKLSAEDIDSNSNSDDNEENE